LIQDIIYIVPVLFQEIEHLRPVLPIMVQPDHGVIEVKDHDNQQSADVLALYLGIHKEEYDSQPEQQVYLIPP